MDLLDNAGRRWDLRTKNLEGGCPKRVGSFEEWA
jgi:hypothetical protein